MSHTFIVNLFNVDSMRHPLSFTSGNPTPEVCVWLYLPGDIQATLCGRFTLGENAREALGTFCYDKAYLANPDALPIAPVLIELSDRPYSTAKLRGFFTPMLDAMPDAWGRRAIDWLCGPQPNAIGYMLHCTDDRVGNLAFSASADTPPPQDSFGGIEDIAILKDLLLSLEDGHPPQESAISRGINTALGGARPKLTLQHDNALWLAKFPSRNDPAGLSNPRIEAAMLRLATLCGIDTVQSLLLEDVLLLRRFDRSAGDSSGKPAGWRRDAFASAMTVCNSSPEPQPTTFSGSYPRLAKELDRWSARPAADKVQLYRRMVFNCCISNTDDHERNHGLIADEENPSRYRLSPAYDLVPQIHMTQRRFQAMDIGNEGAAPGRSNILSDSGAFGLGRYDAGLILEEVESTVRQNWEACLLQGGVADDVVIRLASCFGELPP